MQVPAPIHPAGSGVRPMVIAHRGFHNGGDRYENTMPAFEAAAKLGADLIETDVRRTKDGQLVLHHDPHIDGVKIADTPYHLLPRVGPGIPIPRLGELLDLARRTGARLDIELKESGYEAQALQAIRAVLPTDQFNVISFNKKSIRAIEQSMPEVVTGLLCPRVWPWLRESFVWPTIAKVLDPLDLPIRAARAVQADFASVDRRSVTNRLLDRAAKAGIGIDAWTVDDPDRIAQWVNDPRVRGVTTDVPDLALRLRKGATTLAGRP